MSEEKRLRRKAREAIRDRRMPRRYPERLWGGPGTGGCCTICGEPVGSDEIEFELEFARPDERPGHGNARVHTRCFSEWETVCRDPGSALSARSSALEDGCPARAGASRN